VVPHSFNPAAQLVVNNAEINNATNFILVSFASEVNSVSVTMQVLAFTFMVKNTMAGADVVPSSRCQDAMLCAHLGTHRNGG
jgi:hypothetical protein